MDTHLKAQGAGSQSFQGSQSLRSATLPVGRPPRLGPSRRDLRLARLLLLQFYEGKRTRTFGASVPDIQRTSPWSSRTPPGWSSANPYGWPPAALDEPSTPAPSPWLAFALMRSRLH